MLMMSIVFLAVLAALPTVMDAQCTEASYIGRWKYELYNSEHVCDRRRLSRKEPDDIIKIDLKEDRKAILVGTIPAGGSRPQTRGTWTFVTHIGKINVSNVLKKLFLQRSTGTCGQAYSGVVNEAMTGTQIACFEATKVPSDR